MKGQMLSKKEIYYSQGIDGINMGYVHSNRKFTKAIIPILGIMILFLETHKCLPIVMWIGLAIWV